MEGNVGFHEIVFEWLGPEFPLGAEFPLAPSFQALAPNFQARPPFWVGSARKDHHDACVQNRIVDSGRKRLAIGDVGDVVHARAPSLEASICM